MPQTFKVKNSVEAGKVPAAGDLATAELGLNLKDQKLYSKDAEGNVFEIGVCDWEDIKDNPITIDGTQPSLPEIGDLWVDLGECPPQLKIWSDCEDPGKPEWISIGGAAGKPGLITKQPTLTANNSGYAPCTLTATEGEATFATKVDEEWYLDGVEIVDIGDGSAQTLVAATPGTYKYEEKWVGDDGNLLLASAEIVVNNLELAQPSVLTPPDGAGVGGDVSYTPETSAITGVVDIPGGWNAASATLDSWVSVAYGGPVGQEKFVAIASGSATNTFVMYSTDAINWNPTTPLAGGTSWYSVTYGNGKFVAVSSGGISSAMYSTDGINWTPVAVSTNSWTSVTYGDNTFVAVAQSGDSNRVMTSTNGINWALRTVPEFNMWNSVTYGDDKFVAVSGSGNSNRVMWSTDAINWTAASAPTNNWHSVTYGDGKFVAVSVSGNSNRVMWSTDAINWNSASATEANSWRSVTYDNGKFVAVADSGTNRVMHSADGINWTSASATEANGWYSVTYGDGKFVAVSYSGTNRVMSSPTGADASTELTLTDSKTYNNADGSDMGQPISETFTAGQTVKGESTSGTYGAPTAAFSTTLYTGTLSGAGTQVVDTGIDNTTKSLVWLKAREDTQYMDHALYDNLRGVGKKLATNQTEGQLNWAKSFSSFNNNGFSMSDNTMCNSGIDYVAWNFRAAPGFMDIVTYEGNATGPGEKLIPHSLGSVPGMIIYKNIDAAGDWFVYHKDLSPDHNWLNFNNTSNGSNSMVTPTDTDIVIDELWSSINTSGNKYVAYLFAADTPDLIKCGSYDGNGLGPASVNTIDCGFKPGWLLIKKIVGIPGDGGSNWIVRDNKRDVSVLYSDMSAVEDGWGYPESEFTETGFTISGAAGLGNANGEKYIYVAIAEDATAGEFAPSGELTADADAANSTITLTNTTGDWEEAGLKVVNDTEATSEAPGASGIVFTSSEPDTTEGTVTSWGQADWELSTSSDFSTDLQEQSVSLTDSGVQTGPNFTLADDTDYYVRTKYNSSNPVKVSEVSTANHFKTASAAVPDVKDVFSTTLYSGNGQTVGEQVVNTGVDNTNKSLIWIKARNGNYNHALFDTERGVKNYLLSNDVQAEVSEDNSVNEFYSNGFKTGPFSLTNLDTATNYVTWNFKAAPGFFDVVTYDGVNPSGTDYQVVPHNLGVKPGLMIVKNYTAADEAWSVYHKELGAAKYLILNANVEAKTDVGGEWNNTEPTADNFTVGTNPRVNDDGEKHIAYLFADTPDLIKCGSYIGTGTSNTIDCGFKPGWVMIKMANRDDSGSGGANGEWIIRDNVRGGKGLYANSSKAEDVGGASIYFENNGFRLEGNADNYNDAVRNPRYIYVAIADPTTTTYYDEVNTRAVSQHELVRRFGVDADSTNLRNQGIYPLVNQPTGMTEAFVKEGDAYRAIPNRSMDVFHAQQEADAANERLDDANEKLLKIQSDFEARLIKLEGKQTRGKKKDD